MHLQTICPLILLGVLSIANLTISQNPVVNSETESSSVVSKNSQNLQKRPRSDVLRPARQQRPQSSGFGGLLSGLLGTVTQTADTSECPGKCIHALASLLCGQVREDIQCPQGNMRCCVEKPRKKKPSKNPIDNNVSDNPTTAKTTTVKVNKVLKKKKKITTEQPNRKQKHVPEFASLNVYQDFVRQS